MNIQGVNQSQRNVDPTGSNAVKDNKLLTVFRNLNKKNYESILLKERTVKMLNTESTGNGDIKALDTIDEKLCNVEKSVRQVCTNNSQSDGVNNASEVSNEGGAKNTSSSKKYERIIAKLENIQNMLIEKGILPSGENDVESANNVNNSLSNDDREKLSGIYNDLCSVCPLVDEESCNINDYFRNKSKFDKVKKLAGELTEKLAEKLAEKPARDMVNAISKCNDKIINCAGIRNFFFNVFMKIAAFFHLESRFEKNEGSTEKLQKCGISGAKVVDTSRDGNCMLWSAVVSFFGPKAVEENFDYFRNEVIPFLRSKVAKALIDSNRAEKLTSNLGLGAENIKPSEMGVVAKLFGRPIYIISDVGTGGQSYTGYLFSAEGNPEFTPSQGDLHLNDPRVLDALNSGIGIFAFNNHARAIVRENENVKIEMNDIARNFATSNNLNEIKDREDDDFVIVDDNNQ